MRGVRLARLTAAALLLVPAAGLKAQPREQAPARAAQSTAPWVAARPAEFGALAFTADGSFSSVWKHPSKAGAEAKVLADCAKFGRGKCEVVSFQAEVCAAIASFETAKAQAATYSGGGLTRATAQKLALERCNHDRRAQGACKVRAVVCGDGR